MVKTEIVQQEQIKKQSQFREILKRLVRNKTATVGMCIFLTIAVISLLAPVLAPHDFAEMDLSNAFAKPSKDHLLGTDEYGRDYLSRILYGGRFSLGLGLCAQLFSLFFGVVLGCFAGYYGGKVDSIIMRICDVWQSIPGILFTIILCAALGTGWINTVIAMGLGGVPGNCRMIRAQLLSLREREFIEAEHAINCPSGKIMFKHLLPNAISPLIVSSTMGIGNTINGAAGLAYLGLGVQPPTPEWGALISAARAYIRYYPYLILYPGLMLAITILSLNMFGDGLRDAMDPKLKN